MQKFKIFNKYTDLMEKGIWFYSPNLLEISKPWS